MRSPQIYLVRASYSISQPIWWNRVMLALQLHRCRSLHLWSISTDWILQLVFDASFIVYHDAFLAEDDCNEKSRAHYIRITWIAEVMVLEGSTACFARRIEPLGLSKQFESQHDCPHKFMYLQHGSRSREFLPSGWLRSDLTVPILFKAVTF